MIKKLKFMLCHSLNNNKYSIKIYDNNNNLLVDDFTDYFGSIDFKINYDGIYKIIVSNNKITNYIPIYIKKKSPSELVIILNNKIKNNHLITIKITDWYYKNLPIMKGNVILWQKNI